MNLNKIIGLIATVLFISLALILIIQIILKLSGHSPSDIQILYVGLSAIISYLLVMSYKMGTFVGEVQAFIKSTKTTLSRLKP